MCRRVWMGISRPKTLLTRILSSRKIHTMFDNEREEEEDENRSDKSGNDGSKIYILPITFESTGEDGGARSVAYSVADISRTSVVSNKSSESPTGNAVSNKRDEPEFSDIADGARRQMSTITEGEENHNSLTVGETLLRTRDSDTNLIE